MMKITRPTLVLDRSRCEENIHRMWDKARRHGLLFRPHFKTHQSLTVGRWFRDAGVTKIAVSSVSMAGYFAGDGWDDITIAFPVNFFEIAEINELAARVNLHLLLSSPERVDWLDKQLSHRVGVYLEIDAGYGRSGVDAGDDEAVAQLIRQVSRMRRLQMEGFLSHTGQTYHARSASEVKRVHDDSLQRLHSLKKKLGSQADGLIFSLGDTPACSISDNFRGIDEMRPGNFVFYDLMQHEIGSCQEEQIAVCLVCPVVARYPARNEVVLYGGAVHLSKEFIEDSGGPKTFGRIVHWNGTTWSSIISHARVSSLSQEHGKIQATTDQVKRMVPGSLIGIIPVHSCLTADLMKGYVTTEGETVDHMSGCGGTNILKS